MTWFYFFLLFLFIGFSGFHLCRTSEIIGQSLGLSQNWIGAVLLATITSTPELISGITSVAYLDLPELAVANALGGNVFNLLFVFAIDLVYRKKLIFSEASQGHLLSGALGILMMGFLLFFYIGQKNNFFPVIGHVGLSALILPILYLLGMRTLYRFETASTSLSEKLPAKTPVSPTIVFQLILSAVAVVFAGVILPQLGARIIEEHGWNQAFVGTLFVAIGTSSPEMAVSLSALRLRAVNLAFSNLLTSNIFNLVIIAVDDYFYSSGPILTIVSDRNILTVVTGILMTSLVMIGLVFQPRKRIFNTVSLISLMILVLYLINNIMLFKLKE
jgi:cation:H+ antiporter